MIRIGHHLLLWACALAGLVSCAESSPDDAATREQKPWETAAQSAEEHYRNQQFDQARAGFGQAMQLAQAAGDDHGRFAALEGLAASAAVGGDLATADSLYSILLTWQQGRVAIDSLSGITLVRTLGSLGEINLGLGRVSTAEACFERILQLDRDGTIDLRAEEPALAYVLHGLGQSRASQGNSAAADSLLGRALGLRMYGQGFSLYVGDDLEGAEDAWRKALAQQQQALGIHEDGARTAHALGRLLALRGLSEEAAEQLRYAASTYAASGTAPTHTAAVLQDLARLVQQTDPATADSLRRQAQQLRQQVFAAPKGDS